ncbi:cilia- and flagella-associated protein 44 isoform X1 [Oxyura jamaicensis]|uniref:cilia- and flagella-associated protein 44 isoform X1 n=1 Tax=Oxyura jamaicensis TaxID=8884 RepID=UPI0015A5EB5F|nr:cilia- and flagella-associated protein 44 isoform X1 [Oxyura jamaicensis]XP_035170781.1 cilia- and flagella-associated protein 44 isoform X1 [Oxyura jamaicensis]
MPSPGEQKGADEKPAEGTQADPSGVQESRTSLPKEPSTAEEQEEDVEEVESDTESIADYLEEEDNSEVAPKAEKRPEKIEKKISENFFYNREDVYSRPFVTEDSGIPINLLTLEHSFGYDCKRSVNLMVMDSQTLLYIAGNQVVLLDLKTESQSYLRSSSGGGIGFITAHPTKQYFAVGEKGEKPNLIIYDYPSLRPYRILRGGTEKAYVFGDFNRAGTLLASIGSSPDYMLTIWDWKQEKIVLRSKAFSQDVYRVTFSPDNEEQLTTVGVGHIRFWKMALTFTGLKLQGALGRFGKTPVTDIIGYVELPDGKVISGSEWGNLLLWEGGLIKVELCRAGHKPCHSGPITQLVLDEGELTTVGQDGFIRVWNFETIDAADSVDDTGLLEVEPMNELHVGRNVSLNFMSKVHDSGQPIWYAQDANGAIWKLDLTFSNMTRDPECVYTFHSGRIEAVSVSPVTYLMATTALDRSVRIYDFISNSQLSEIQFKQGGTALTWAPRGANPKGGLIAVGFEDGVVRIIEIYDPEGLAVLKGRTNIGNAEINLKQAFKPHTSAVTALAYDRDGDVLATGSKDKTVFFFAVEDKYEPIGFIHVPGPVQALQWSPPSHMESMLLILCENGFVLQVPAPVPEEQDTASTYQIKNLPTQYFHFYSIKSRIKLEEEIALREKKKQEKEKAKLEWIKQQKEMGKDIEEEPEEEPEEEEPLPPLYIPEEPSPILCGFYSAPGKFWLSLGGYDSGFLYHCAFSSNQHQEDPEQRQDEPFEVIPIEDTDNNPIHRISFCTSRLLMFCGMQNGALRVYALQDKDLSANNLKDYWSFNVHDNDYGQIRGICSSYDDRFLVTCGGDGNIFTFNILSPEDAHKELRAKIPSPRSGLEMEKATEDIEDPNAYNIEEVKQKEEYERIMKEAEDKKSKKREELTALRQEFLFLLQKNQELPKHMQLHRDQYEMDHRIFEDLNRQTAQKIQLVEKELAWEHEKNLIGLQKLQNWFRSSLEFDTVVVHAIQSNHQISTYRLLALSEKYCQDKESPSWRKTVLKRAWKRMEKKETIRETMHASIFEGEAEKLKKSDVQKPTARFIESKREQIRRIAEKSNEMKAKIMKRNADWEKLYKSKPSDDYENPKDVQAIKEAQENMGCYKLKTANDYRVPQHEHMNTEKKAMQLASLEVLIHKKKVNMNKQIMSLRDLKVSVIDEIKCLVQELKSIQAALDLSEHLPLPPIPQLHPDEVPEKKFEYDTDILLKFKQEQEAKAKLQEPLEGFPSSGALRRSFLRASSLKESGPVTQPAREHPIKIMSSVIVEQEKLFEIEKAEPTEMELEILKREKIKNLYVQDSLIKKINSLVINFDAELRVLRHKKLQLDVQMKHADLRYITWYEELLILKNTEKTENVLQGHVNTLRSEQEAMQSKLNSYLAQMEDRKSAIVKLRECKKALYASFQASLGESNKFAHFLTKVLKKKIKRMEKKEVEREADEKDESEWESDEESSLGSDEEDSRSEDEVFDVSVCPKNCDKALFQNTIQLREKWLDIEEALSKEKRVAVNLRKEYNVLVKKAKAVEASLNTAERELDTFQWEKQQKLNELYVVVPLKLHQVEYLVNGKIPSDLSQALVFTNQSLEYLQKRIVDLRNEKIMQREMYKKAQQQHKQLIQDKKEMEINIRRLEEECNQLMMLKFGRMVDFEAVQARSVNIRLEELEVEIMQKEYEHSQELKEWEKKTLDLEQKLMMLTKENTRKLQQLNRFCLEKQQLETTLDSLKNDLGAEFQGPRTTDIKEKARMESLLKHRAHDIALLREEINFLSRKDGCLRERLSLLNRKDGCLFLQPSSPQDSAETLSEPFPVLTP